MVGTCRLAKCAEVTAGAFGGESETIKLAHRTHLVAGVAVDGGVSTNQREPILMLIDVMN